jgi:dolichol-phosphate mannosyltransferase
MSESVPPRVSVVSPAYNEEEVIVEVVKDWIRVLDEDGSDWEIVIVDDGSTDRTGELLLGLSEPRVRVIRFERNRGYGPALSAALAEARGRYRVTIDSDGQFDLGDYKPLLRLLEESGLDLVTGYRRRKQDTFLKVAVNRMLKLIVQLVFRTGLRDTNCALKVLTGEVSRKVRIEATGFPTPTEIIVRAAHMGYKMGEGPVDHRPRAGGKSKLGVLSTALSFSLFLAYLRLQLFLIDRGVIKEEKK